MTEREHPNLKQEGEKEEQNQAEPKKASANLFISKDEMEAEEHHANIADKNIRTGITKDIRPMRWMAVLLATVLPMVILALLYAQITSYFGMLDALKGAMAHETKTMAEAIEAAAMPMTALIVGTFICVTAIYSALLIGLFRSISESRDKLSMADIYPILSVLQKASSASGK